MPQQAPHCEPTRGGKNCVASPRGVLGCSLPHHHGPRAADLAGTADVVCIRAGECTTLFVAVCCAANTFCWPAAPLPLQTYLRGLEVRNGVCVAKPTGGADAGAVARRQPTAGGSAASEALESSSGDVLYLLTNLPTVAGTSHLTRHLLVCASDAMGRRLECAHDHPPTPQITLNYGTDAAARWLLEMWVTNSSVPSRMRLYATCMLRALLRRGAVGFWYATTRRDVVCGWLSPSRAVVLCAASGALTSW